MQRKSLVAAPLLALIAVVAACNKSPDTPVSPVAAEPSNAPASAASKNPANTGSSAAVARDPNRSDFSVRVVLSPLAEKFLAKKKETIIASADYYGWPIDPAASTVNDVGQIDLGREQHDIDGPGTMRFTGSSYVHVLPSMLKGPPEVNINIYSGRRSSADNLLDCDIFQDTIAVAHSTAIALQCKLITEKVTH